MRYGGRLFRSASLGSLLCALGGRRVRSGSLDSLVSALGVLRIARGSLVRWVPPWVLSGSFAIAGCIMERP